MQTSLIQPFSDEYIKQESERQLNRPVEIQKTHMSLRIKAKLFQCQMNNVGMN